MEENSNGNQSVPVLGPGPDAPRKEDTISKQRDLTLEEMKELNLSASSHAIPPEEAVRDENVLSPEAEMIKLGRDAIQEAVDFITGGVQEFDGYVTDCAEEVADYDMPFFSGFSQGYMGRGGSFSIAKALGSIGRAAVNMTEGIIMFPLQAAAHPIETAEGMMELPIDYAERFRSGTWTERVTVGTEIAAMVGLTMESAAKLRKNMKQEKLAGEAARRQAAKNRENGLPAGCFTAGTQILTEKGTKAIEEIQAGDYVLAEDLESGKQEYKKVVRTTVRMAEKLIHLSIRGEEIPVYNMEVEEYHTYYIANSGILVRNDGGCPKTKGEVRMSAASIPK